MLMTRRHSRRRCFVVLLLAALLSSPAPVRARDEYRPAPSNLAARGRVRCEPLAARFNPVKFDAAAWVSLARAAGVRYITITSKHHDGFAMFDSRLTDWDIVDRPPYKRDVLKQLPDECHRQGIRLFF